MNPINPVNTETDCAEVYFTDGVCLGPMIAMRSVGDELAELITGTIDQLEFQELLPASLGTAGAVFVFRAVYACNHVSLNAPPNLNGLGAQIGYLHRREYAPGGVGVVIIDMREEKVTTYGGRGFPSISAPNLFQATSVTFEELRSVATTGNVQAPLQAKGSAAPAKKAAPRKKAARKKAARKKGGGDDTVRVNA